MVKITPVIGIPYYLIDYDGDISPLEKVDEIIKETQIFDVEEKLQEISGEIQIMSTKLDGKRFW